MVQAIVEEPTGKKFIDPLALVMQDIDGELFNCKCCGKECFRRNNKHEYCLECSPGAQPKNIILEVTLGMCSLKYIKDNIDAYGCGKNECYKRVHGHYNYDLADAMGLNRSHYIGG